MKLAWNAIGDGPPLVLLHGFTGSRSSWGRAAESLARQFRTVRIDLPGHGASPTPGSNEGYADAVASVAETIAVACRGPAAVLGYSQGARLALGLALDAPTTVGALILESGSPGLADAAARAARHDEDTRWIELLVRQGMTAFVEQWEDLPVLAGLKRLPAAERAWLRELRLAQRPEGLAAALRSFGLGAQPDLRSRLAERRGPTLVLTGQLDPKITAIGAELASGIPRAQHCILPGCGHTPHLEEPEAWAGAVVTFLEAARSELQPRRTA